MDVSSEDDLLAWQDALERIRPTPGPTASDTRAPYQGMESFQPEDAEWFFGREDLVEQLLEELSLKSLVAIVGPSGAGKSSLLRAGLVPRIPGSFLLTPTSDPAGSLRAALDAPVEANPGSSAESRVLVIDQMEELFIACGDEDNRQTFTSLLEELPARGIRVVFGLRADFYNHALRYPVLAHSLQDSQLLLDSMTPEQLRRAITEPAHKARVRIEDGLVELLQRDLGGIRGAAYDAGRPAASLTCASDDLGTRQP